jgi:hypothetical protein
LKKLVPPENGEQFCHPLDFWIMHICFLDLSFQ